MLLINRLLEDPMALEVLTPISACSSEVSSDQWCADMKATPSGEWTVNQATDFAKNCILK